MNHPTATDQPTTDTNGTTVTVPTVAPGDVDHPPPAEARVSTDPVVLIQAIAELLTPCAPPEIAAGWNLCAHAQPWPCPTTRAYWLARNATR